MPAPAPLFAGAGLRRAAVAVDHVEPPAHARAGGEPREGKRAGAGGRGESASYLSRPRALTGHKH